MKELMLMERDERSVVRRRVSLRQCPSMREWVLNILHERGAQTLEEVAGLLPSTNWAQLLLAIDKLDRDGAIDLRFVGHGEYLLSLNENKSPAATRRAIAKRMARRLRRSHVE
jgi:hypothetical protein